ncbi:alkane hydroxylase MAH1-like [Hibiscus syriacus]|nr:alkane hydroxylase MAH1-like [Hibiscus syriacus]
MPIECSIFFTDMLKSNGGTFKIIGPWFASSDFVLTAHPMNINNVFCKNHVNYVKGPELRQILEPYEGIIISDSDVWKRQKKVLMSFFKYNKKSAAYMDRILLQVLKGSLFPVLDHFQTLGTEVNLEDVLGRFNYDYMCLLGFGFNPKTLSAELPVVEITEALGHIDEALVHRRVVPQMIWKLQKWLQIGKEKKLNRGLKMVDDFSYKHISSIRDELRRSKAMADDRFDALTAFMVEEEASYVSEMGKSDKFLRDVVYDFLTVGKDSTTAGLTCFLWLVSTHPWVETQILEEIKANCPESNDGKVVYFTPEELNKFVYLRAAFCETLRLYPSVPLDFRSSIAPDVLPSGDRIGPNTRILISLYSMGRSEEIWGEDCMEFRPERWISEVGDFVPKPASMYLPFGVRQRACLGKELSLKMMNTVAINVLRHYEVKVVEDQKVAMTNKVLALTTQHGLKNGGSQRWESSSPDRHPYLPFGVGQRASLGKELSLKMINTVAINVLRHYEVRVVEDQKVAMTNKVLALTTQHGLKVRINKRKIGSPQ